mgnify:CR=1 FL=1
MAHSIHFIETISLSPYRIPYNSWITSAQHLMCVRTTADMQAHNSCCAVYNCIVSKNRHYIFQQLLILFSIAYPITYDRLSYYLRLLILLLTSAYPITYNNRRYLLAAVILFAFVWHQVTLSGNAPINKKA